MYDHVVDERMGYTEMGGLGFDLYSFSCPALIIITGLYYYLIMFYCMSERDWENEGWASMRSVELMARDTTTLPHEA